MSSQTFDLIDNVNGRIPPPTRWLLAGMGGVAGLVYAQRHGTSLPVSYIIAGVAVGFGFLLIASSGLKLLKHAFTVTAFLVGFNYVVLIPFGYGNHLPGWMSMARTGSLFLLETLTRLANEWVNGLR